MQSTNYFLEIEKGNDSSIRNVTEEVNLFKGVQGYYHIAKTVFQEIDLGLKVTLFKETDKGREFIYNIP